MANCCSGQAGVVVTPDGATVFATDGFDNNVYDIDTAHNALNKMITAGTNPGPLAITSDGSQVWVGDYRATSISVIDVASATVVNTIPIGNLSYAIAFGPR